MPGPVLSVSHYVPHKMHKTGMFTLGDQLGLCSLTGDQKRENVSSNLSVSQLVVDSSETKILTWRTSNQFTFILKVTTIKNLWEEFVLILPKMSFLMLLNAINSSLANVTGKMFSYEARHLRSLSSELGPQILCILQGTGRMCVRLSGGVPSAFFCRAGRHIAQGGIYSRGGPSWQTLCWHLHLVWAISLGIKLWFMKKM